MILTIFIIAITAGISVIAFKNHELFYKLQFNPYQVYHRKEWYRLISHGFVHADWSHLLFNMFSFFFFAPIVIKNINSSLLFLVLYLGGIIVASSTTLVKQKDNHWYNSVGASGGVSAVIFASILYEPWSKLIVFPIPFPIPGFVFAILFLAFSHYMGKKQGDNINHDAHFLGALFGFTFPILLHPSTFIIFIERLFQFNF